MKKFECTAFVCLMVINAMSCSEALTTEDLSPLSDALIGDSQQLESDSSATEDVSPLPIAPSCDESLRPIVFVHGFLASGDTWSQHSKRFIANGYCRSHLRAFDWNTLDQSEDWTAKLDDFIDETLDLTGSDRVDLIGHSAGAGLTYGYLTDPSSMLKVSQYVYAGYRPQAQPAGPVGEVPTLYLWSKGDTAMRETGIMPGAETVVLETADHYSVVSDIDSFMAIYAHLHEGSQPKATSALEGYRIEAMGKALTFAENTPTEGEVVVQSMDPETGRPLKGASPITLQTEKDGAWGPIEHPTGAPIHYRVTPNDGTRSVNYFREPMTSTDPMVYIRTIPSGDGLASILLSGLPFNDDHSILVIFSASRALDVNKDSLTVDGVEVLNADTADPSNTTIALFLYDEDEDGTSSLEPNSLFASFPFLAGLDMALSSKADTISIQLNDRMLKVPALPSDSDGVTVVVFD